MSPQVTQVVVVSQVNGMYQFYFKKASQLMYQLLLVRRHLQNCFKQHTHTVMCE